MRIDRELRLTGDENFPVNRGALCIKGWTSTELLSHPERLLRPLARNRRGEFETVSWEMALELVTANFLKIREKHGRDALGILGGGSMTNEKAYLIGKFARVALGTSNVDYNGRFCMSSAAAAMNKAFGIDRGLPFPVEDIAKTGVVLLVGSNIAETMPPMMQYFEEMKARGGTMIVIDPRRSATAQAASLHLQPAPGTDGALANGLLHLLIREGLIDRGYIEARTSGFSRVKSVASTYWPDRVERITGVAEANLLRVVRALGKSDAAMILTARGTEQHSQGVNNTLAFINLALALGLPGKPSSGFGTITGQGNGQGGREHGQKADQLPGYRKIDDPAARRHIAGVWKIEEKDLPGPGKSAYEMIDSFGRADGVRAVLALGFNFAVSAPGSDHVTERIGALEFLAVSDFFMSETAKLADVVLPAAMWAEEEGTMTNLEGRVIRRRRAVPPPREARSDWQVLCDLAGRMGKQKYFPYADAKEIFEELRRASQGGVADYWGITYRKIEENDGVFWPCPSEDQMGTPRLFKESFYTPECRARFHPVRHQATAEPADAKYPLYLTTGRVMAHYQSGTQTRRVERLMEILPEAFVEIHPKTAKSYGLAEGDDVVLATRRGKARFKVRLTAGIREDTIFTPIHWVDEHSANRLTNPALDQTSRMPEFKICAVRIENRYSEGQ
jgi:assimilatory nitrate reductase catalytic subunit